MIGVVLGIFCSSLIISGAFAAEATRTVDAPRWVIDPRGVDANLPPVGRSLFDYLVTEELNGQRAYKVPFPYSEFIRTIDERLQGPNYVTSHVKQVLIPLGRSLQRNAAAPEFFRFPRVVAAVDTEAGEHGDARMLLKDRLYIGFGEKSAILEVISYNEAAGRFEFQVVNDYRPGGTPQVAYADRAVCVSCHQNAASIFSRQSWDETNANPQIAALLKKEGKSFHGVLIGAGVDIPFAVDQATQRANEFALTQLLWREGCGGGSAGARCRGYALVLALQYRMSGERGFDLHAVGSEAFHAVLQKQWRERWPGGLYLPDPTLPNRDPLLLAADRGAARIEFPTELGAQGKNTLQNLLGNTDIRAPFEPLESRAPLLTWTGTQPGIAERLVHGLAEFITQGDARRFDQELFKRAAQQKTALQQRAGRCEFVVKKLDGNEALMGFSCRAPDQKAGTKPFAEGRAYLAAGKVTHAEVDSLTFNGAELRTIEVMSPVNMDRSSAGWSLTLRLTQNGMHVRAADGAMLDALTLRGSGSMPGASNGTALLAVRDDFAPVWAAVNALSENNHDVLSERPFRRAAALPALLAQLGLPLGAWCCIDDHGMPPVLDDRTVKISVQR